MTRTKKITISVLALAAIGATTAYAFSPEGRHHGMGRHMSGHQGMMGGHHGMGGKMGGRHHGKAMFKKLDADKDGVVTRQEAETARTERFAKMDEDGDGVVSVAEIDAAIEKRLRRMQVRMRYKMLAKMDRNGDGQIDKEEFAKKAMKMFDRADVNGDNKVTREEARKMHRGSRGHGKKRWRHGKNHHGYGQGKKYGYNHGYGNGYGKEQFKRKQAEEKKSN